MRFALVGAVAALVAGVALIALSVAEGGASVGLVVVVPVVSGSSLLFLVGVLLLIVGFFALPFALAARWEEEPPLPSPPSPARAEREGGVGGFVLIGPFPVVFGTWKGVSRRTRWLLALGGAVLFTVAFVAVVLFLR